MRWSYRVRNRARWRDDQAASLELENQARRDLLELGIGHEALSAAVEAGLLEVSIPFVSEQQGWDARILPWEALLTAATRSEREGRPLLIVRHLSRPAVAATVAPPEQALIVISEPGRLEGHYSFESERRLIEAHLAVKDAHVLESPTREALALEVRRRSPQVVHLSGFDAHQGAVLLGIPTDSSWRDGFYLASSRAALEVCEPEPLALALSAGNPPPRMVTCNAYNTAARIAALIVAHGAGAAIGFQDDVDDSVAERFFASFYRAWVVSGFDTLPAFRFAWREAREVAPLRGTGIVLWSAAPLVSEKEQPATEDDRLGKRLRDEREQTIVIDVGRGDDLRQILERDVQPLEALNYGLLHNGGSLFETFRLRKLRTGVLRDVRVEVSLSVGPQEFRYRESLDLDLPVTDITDKVRLPLTWDYIRSMRENTRTGLYVEIAVRDRILHSRTYPIVLLPVEEWRDTRRDGKWLPSFVLPRDPAVAAIVDRAQRYLMALRDDPGAGFDGYQSIDEAAADPAEAVDLQVQALWSAIVYEYGLSYINPPPTYTASSQRLRCPYDVIEGRRGTCIDLALLLASCLEYVDIYPVLFLLKGHAIPGYWRSEKAHRDFISMQRVDEGQNPRSGGRQHDSWVIPAEAYHEIVSLVRANQLVPLETVWLTQHKGYGDATEAGIEDLDDREQFEAMLDVVRAREASVTPLPLRGSLR
jgi:CHAT domain